MPLLAVNFHYVRERAPGRGIYPVTPAAFERQLRELGRHYRFVGQRDLIALTEGADPDENLCLITFDDGLREQMQALAVLDRLDIPALFFVTTDAIAERRVVAVHKLHYVRSRVDDGLFYQRLAREVDLTAVAFDDAALARQYRYDEPLARRAKYLFNFVLSDAAQRRVADDLFRALVDDEAEFASDLYMGIPELRELGRRGMLATHGASHRPLATLDDGEIENEIGRSLAFLREVVPRATIAVISYPYGGPTAVNARVATFAARAGLRAGFTMTRGVNGAAELRDPLLLRRVDTNDAPGGRCARAEYLP